MIKSVMIISEFEFVTRYAKSKMESVFLIWNMRNRMHPLQKKQQHKN